ncbi:hypothetical protein R1flu_001470 [Riccia fluitans]|uniref:Uncharacterized protein n=1 Tax=Riccia fluitans TaxID=41844 RepID=A0ABD1Y3G1_9MARC
MISNFRFILTSHTEYSNIYLLQVEFDVVFPIFVRCRILWLSFFRTQERDEDHCRKRLWSEQKRKYISEIQSWQKILNRGESEIGPFATDDPEIDEGDELDTDVILELQVQVEFLEDRVKRLEKEAETADQMRVH